MSSDHQAMAEEARQFHHAFASVLLATATKEGNPTASYAPYLADEDPLAFYIFISELAEHTGNLRQNPRASLLFIDNESVSSSLFARKRITYYCKAEFIPRDQAIFDTILDRFEARHGPMVALLKTLRDFQLFRLSPMKASYVRGFGEAFELDPSDDSTG